MMLLMTRNRLPGYGFLLIFSFWISWTAGCAGPSGLASSHDQVQPFRDPALSMKTARDSIVVGTATKADVMGLLGVATVIRFDSGFEVWVYRGAAGGRGRSADRAEFVLLFTPAGVVKKIRVRTGGVFG